MAESLLEIAQIALRLPEPAHSRWHRAGVSPRGERVIDIVSALVLLTFASGWSWSIAEARAHSIASDDMAVTPATAKVSAALTDPAAPSMAFLTQAALEMVLPLRGFSGKLQASVRATGTPLPVDSLPGGAHVEYTAAGTVDTADAAAPDRKGVWRLALRLGAAVKPIADFSVITALPFEAKRSGRIGLYYLGRWPTEGRRAPRAGYAPPSGFIEVTPQNQETPVSEHFRLRDFLTKDQRDVWPKYLVLDMKLIDKLELVLAELNARGHDVSGVRVMSGFRTPQYNVAGGDPRGRASLSRHMYGDAADIYFDRDGVGRWDDLNGDGRVNVGDVRVVLEAVERVERAHPTLVGGAGIYSGTSAHGPFIHIDTRGYRARWTGSGDGG